MKRVGGVPRLYSVCLPFPLPACRRQTHNGSERIQWHSQTLQNCAAAGRSHSKHCGVHCASSSVDGQGASGCRGMTLAPKSPACAAAGTCLMSPYLWHQLLYIHRALECQTTAYKKLIKILLKMNSSTNVFSAFLNLVQVHFCTQFSPVDTQEKIVKFSKFQVDTVTCICICYRIDLPRPHGNIAVFFICADFKNVASTFWQDNAKTMQR